MSLPLEKTTHSAPTSRPSVSQPVVAKSASPNWLKLVGEAVAQRPEAPKVARPTVKASAQEVSQQLTQSRPAPVTSAQASRSATWSMASMFKSSQEEVASPGEIATTLEENLSDLDSAAGGRRDGVFGSQDLEAIANDPNASAEARAAAQQVIDDPNLYHALDVADGDDLDDKISLGDLDQMQANQGPDAQDKPAIMEVANQLNTSFTAFDSAQNGEEDGVVSTGDLEIVANDSSRSANERELAQMLLDDPTYWDAFDVGNRDGGKDGKVSRDDMKEVRLAPSVDNVNRDTWGPGSEAALDRALENGDWANDDMFDGFSQTDMGNCVSTAIIKGAMDHYGNEVFDEVSKNEDGGYTVTLQDGQNVSVTREEMEATAAGTHYESENPEMRAYATLSYAVMAKRSQEMGHDDSRTFGEALNSLANGENPEDTPAFLGLQNNVRRVDIEDVKGMDGVVAWGDGHCVYVDTINGQTFGDAWGTRKTYDGSNYVTQEHEDGTQEIGELHDAYVFV